MANVHLAIWMSICFICVQSLRDSFHPIHTYACRTYNFDIDITEGTGVIYESIRHGRFVCSKSVFGLSYNPMFDNKLNCSIDPFNDTFSVCFYNISKNDSGEYRLYAGVHQQNTTIFVMDTPTIPEITPASALEGSQVGMTCVSHSTPTPHGQKLMYTWAVNDSSSYSKRYKVNGNQMVVDNLQLNDQYNRLRCTVTERYGLSSMKEEHLRVRLLHGIHLKSAASAEAFIGRPYTLTCMITQNFTSTSIVGIGWMRREEGGERTVSQIKDSDCSTVGARVQYNYSCNHVNEERREFHITILNVSISDNGTHWKCYILGLGNSSNVMMLIAKRMYKVNIKSLKTYPTDSVEELTNVTMVCTFNSSTETRVTWSKKTGHETTTLRDEIGQNQSNFTILSVTCRDFANYTCSVQNGDGSWVSASSMLRIYCQPRILDCALGTTILDIAEKDILNITIYVIGYPTPTIGIEKATSTRNQNFSFMSVFEIQFQPNGPYSTFTITKNQTANSDFGDYTISFDNNYGADRCIYRIRKIDEEVLLAASTTQSNIVPYIVSPLVVVFVVLVTVSAFIAVRRKNCNRSNSRDADVLNMPIGLAIPGSTSYQDLDRGKVQREEHHYTRYNQDETTASSYQGLVLPAFGGGEHQYTGYNQDGYENGDQSQGEYEQMAMQADQPHQYVSIVGESVYHNTILDRE